MQMLNIYGNDLAASQRAGKCNGHQRTVTRSL